MKKIWNKTNRELNKDPIYLTWLSTYAEGWITYLEYEMENSGFYINLENLIKIFNVIQFDELEKYLFYKYWVDFVKICLKLMIHQKWKK